MKTKLTRALALLLVTALVAIGCRPAVVVSHAPTHNLTAGSDHGEAVKNAPLPGFVYKQGGTAASGIFTTFCAAYVAAHAVGVPAQIIIDDSAGTPVTGACGSIDLSNIDLVSLYYKGTATQLTFQTGTTVTGFRQIRNRLYLKNTAATPVLTISAPRTAKVAVFKEESGLVAGGSGAAAFFRVSAGATSPGWQFYEASSLANNGGTGNNIFTVDTGVTAALNFVGGPSIVQNFALAGAGNYFLISYASSAPMPTAAFPDSSGTITKFHLDTATGMSFTDQAAPNKLVETPGITGYPSVQEGLDALKAQRFFTWKPGATTANGVYGTWAEVVTAVSKVQGYRKILIDMSTSAAVLPAGAWDLSPTGIVGDVELSFNRATKYQANVTTSGAVSLKGVTVLDGINITNTSSIGLFVVSGDAAFKMTQNARIYQAAAAGAPAFTLTSGVFLLDLKDLAGISTLDTGTNAITVAGATMALHLSDAAFVTANQINRTSGTVIVTIDSPSAAYAAQTGSTAVPGGGLSKGTTTLASGVSPSLTTIGAPGTILAFYRTPSGSTATAKLVALAADRVSAVNGTFKVSALKADETINTADNSTVDWLAY